MVTNKVPLVPKSAEKFSCEKCDFTCSKQSNYMRHCSTRKHIDVTNVTNDVTKTKSDHKCGHCGKIYESRMGLWRHTKKCTSKISGISNELTVQPDDDILSNEPIKNYIMKLVEQNNELKNMFIQQSI